MNKREKAIWKLVTVLSLFLISYFTYISIMDFKQLNLNINGDKSLKNNSKSAMGMLDYIYEFEKYPGSLDEKYITQNKMLKVIDFYGLNSNKILKETQKGYRNTETKMYKHGFIETYTNPKSKNKNSSVYGFSLIDSSIKKGEFFLTEIKGSYQEFCNSAPQIKNIALKNNDSTVGFPLEFKIATSESRCDEKKDIKGNRLCIKANGELWYSFEDNVYDFEFNIISPDNQNYSFSDEVLDKYYISNEKGKKVTAIPKNDNFISKGVGMLLKFQKESIDFDLDDIILSSKGKLYDKRMLEQSLLNDDSYFNNINFFYSNLNSDGNLEVYLSTNDDFDEYYFEVTCFECAINNNEKNLNELEIIRAKLKERNFYFELDTNDPSDLTNIVIFEGQDGYNQGKRLRAVIPTNITLDQSGFGRPIGLAEYQGQTFTVTIGDTIGGYRITDMTQKYFLGVNLQSTNTDTLRYKQKN